MTNGPELNPFPGPYGPPSPIGVPRPIETVDRVNHDTNVYRADPTPENLKVIADGARENAEYYDWVEEENAAYDDLSDVLRPPIVNSNPKPGAPLAGEAYPKVVPANNAERVEVSEALGEQAIAVAHRELNGILLQAKERIRIGNIAAVHRATELEKEKYKDDPQELARLDAEFAGYKSRFMESQSDLQASVAILVANHPSLIGELERVYGDRIENFEKSEGLVQKTLRERKRAVAVVTGHFHPASPDAPDSAEADDRMAESAAITDAQKHIHRHNALSEENAAFFEFAKRTEHVRLLIDTDAHFDAADVALERAVTNPDLKHEHALYAISATLHDDVQKIREWKQRVDQVSAVPEDRDYTDQRFEEMYRQYAAIEYARRRLLIETQERNSDGNVTTPMPNRLMYADLGGGSTDGSILVTRESLHGADSETAALYPDGSYRLLNADNTWGNRLGVYGEPLDDWPTPAPFKKDELAFDPAKERTNHEFFFGDEEGDVPTQADILRDPDNLAPIWDIIMDAKTLWLARPGDPEAEAELRDVIMEAQISLTRYATRPQESTYTPEHWNGEAGVKIALEVLHRADYIQAMLDNNRPARTEKNAPAALPYQLTPAGNVFVRDPNNRDSYTYEIAPDGTRYYRMPEYAPDGSYRYVVREYEPGEPDPKYEPPQLPPTPTPPPAPAPPVVPPRPTTPPRPTVPPKPATPPPAPPAPSSAPLPLLVPSPLPPRTSGSVAPAPPLRPPAPPAAPEVSPPTPEAEPPAGSSFWDW